MSQSSTALMPDNTFSLSEFGHLKPKYIQQVLELSGFEHLRFFLLSVRPKQIRFRFSAEFRPFWPNFGFAETVNHLSVSDSAETKIVFQQLTET